MLCMDRCDTLEWVCVSVGVAFGHEVALVVLPDACLELADAFEVEPPVLVAAHVLLGVLAHLEEDAGVVLLVDLEPVLQGLHHLLLHLVEQHRRVLREGLGEGGGLEGLVVPDLARQQQHRHQHPIYGKPYLLQLREVSCSLVLSVKASRQAAAIMGISLSILAVSTIFLMKLETLSMVGLKQSMTVGLGSSKIFRGWLTPKSTDSPPRKEDSIIGLCSSNSLWREVSLSSSSSSPSEQASSPSQTSSSSTSSLQRGCRKLSFRISPTSSSISSSWFYWLISFQVVLWKCVCGSLIVTILLATNPEKAQTSSSMSMLEMVEVMRAPSKERFLALTLSIYRLISMIFLVDMELLWGLSPVLRLRMRESFLESQWLVFLMVGLVEVSTAFFLKSLLRSLMGAEYLVLAYLTSLFWVKLGRFFCLAELQVFFLGSDCGVYSLSTRSSCFSQSTSFRARILSLFLSGSLEGISTDYLYSSSCREYEFLARVSMILSSLIVCPGSILSYSQRLRFSSQLMSASLPRLMPQPRWMKPLVYCCRPMVLSSLQAGMESQFLFSYRSSSTCASAPTLLAVSLPLGLREEAMVVFACLILLRCAFSFSPSSNFLIKIQMQEHKRIPHQALLPPRRQQMKQILGWNKILKLLQCPA